MRLGKVFISGGFVLCLTILYLISSFEFMLIILLAVLFHEAGHLIAMKLLGGKINDIRLECLSVLIRYDGSSLSYIKELITALSGPLFSILLAVITALIGKRFGGFWFVLSGLSLVLCLFNLLPVAILDGGRILYMIMAQCWDVDIAEKASFVVSCMFSLVIMILGAWVLRESGWNFTLLLCGVWLFWGSAIVKRAAWV